MPVPAHAPTQRQAKLTLWGGRTNHVDESRAVRHLLSNPDAAAVAASFLVNTHIALLTKKHIFAN